MNEGRKGKKGGKRLKSKEKKVWKIVWSKKQAKPLSNALVNTKANTLHPLKINEKTETIVVTNEPTKKINELVNNIQTKKQEPSKKAATAKSSTPNNAFTYFYPEKNHQIGLSNLHKSTMSSSDEGHSLLWIVVVVLIILWALGIISGSFGLGVLINLLLVIAFVLLILWLLRII